MSITIIIRIMERKDTFFWIITYLHENVFAGWGNRARNDIWKFRGRPCICSSCRTRIDGEGILRVVIRCRIFAVVPIEKIEQGAK